MGRQVFEISNYFNGSLGFLNYINGFFFSGSQTLMQFSHLLMNFRQFTFLLNYSDKIVKKFLSFLCASKTISWQNYKMLSSERKKNKIERNFWPCRNTKKARNLSSEYYCRHYRFKLLLLLYSAESLWKFIFIFLQIRFVVIWINISLIEARARLSGSLMEFLLYWGLSSLQPKPNQDEKLH